MLTMAKPVIVQRPKIKSFTDGVVSATLSEIEWYEFAWACKKVGLTPEQAVSQALGHFVNAVKYPEKRKKPIMQRLWDGIDQRTQIGIKRQPRPEVDWP